MTPDHAALMAAIPAEERLLLACAPRRLDADQRTAAGAIARTVHPDRLLAVADAHGLSGLLYRGLVQLPDPPEQLAGIIATLADRTAAAAIQYEFMLPGQVAAILSTLEAAAIPALVLKGPAVAALYDPLYARPYGDVDLLVAADQLEAAAESLFQLGYTLDESEHPAAWYRTHHQHLAPFVHADSIPVEVHWRLVKPDSPLRIDLNALWDAAESFPLEGISARRLGAAHQIVHLCIHAGGQHLFSMGLKPLCDVAEAITAYGDRLNWDEVVQAARAWGCARHVYLVLQLVAALLRVPPPDGVLDRLYSGSSVDRFLTYAISNILALQRNHKRRVEALVERDWRYKLALLRADYFPPRQQIAAYYALADGTWPGLHYARWIAGQAARQIALRWRLWTGDAATVAQVQHEITRRDLIAWLAGQ
jgi:hypothetical protein